MEQTNLDPGAIWGLAGAVFDIMQLSLKLSSKQLGLFESDVRSCITARISWDAAECSCSAKRLVHACSDAVWGRGGEQVFRQRLRGRLPALCALQLRHGLRRMLGVLCCSSL